MLYIPGLLFVGLFTYIVCLLEHRRVLKKVRSTHRLELRKLNRRINDLTSNNAIHAWQAWMECYKEGVLEVGEETS